MSDPITIRPFRPDDEETLLRGYAQVFPAMTPEVFRWKYSNNPTGEVHIMVADHEQHGVVGAYPTLPALALVDGQTRLVGQGLDHWVLPEHRRHGARPGLFVNTGLAHYERWGMPKGPYACHHGWPTQGWRIGQRYLRYEIIRDWDFLFREVPPGGFAPRSVSAELEVRIVQRFDEHVDRLWAEFAPSTRMALIRDRRYLNWRYADAPQPYELCECRERHSGRLRAIAVLASTDFVLPRTVYIVDWLAPSDDLDATVALVAHAERRAGELGAHTLATLFQHRDPRFLGFQKLGFLVYGTIYFQVVVPFGGPDAMFYKEHWYHTLGDSDLL